MIAGKCSAEILQLRALSTKEEALHGLQNVKICADTRWNGLTAHVIKNVMNPR